MELSVNAAGTTPLVLVSSSAIRPSASVARLLYNRSSKRTRINTILETSINNSSDNVRVRFAWRAGYLLAALGIDIAVQASKEWAVRTLRFGDERIVNPGFAKLL